ncbi:MAG: hypothetical protein E7Z62_05545 [Thermoplasmata archaeon]|nr:hypothetical protein [Thermoplasmata archaeon]
MRGKIIPLLLLATLLAVPLAAPVSDGAVGGEGHGDGIDVIYSSEGIEAGMGILYVHLTKVPSKDISVYLMSVSDHQDVEHFPPSENFNITVSPLVSETYLVMVTLAETKEKIAECELTVGSCLTVTFSAGDGTGFMSPMGVEPGGTLIVPRCTYTAPAGKYFIGWSASSDPEHTFSPGDELTVWDNMTVTALWQASEYTLNFLPGEGSGTMQSVKAFYGDTVKLPDCTFTAPDGKEFSGWKLGDESFGSGDEYKVTRDVAFTAEWSDPLPMTLIAVIIAVLIVVILAIVLIFRRRH